VRLFYNLALDDMLGQQPDGPVRVAFRRLRAGERNQMGLGGTVKDWRNRRFIPLLAGEHCIEPLVDERLSRARDHADIGIERLADFPVQPALASLALIGLQQNARLEYGFSCRLTFRNQPSKLRPLLDAQFHNEFLVGHGLPLCRLSPAGQESVFAAKCNSAI